MKLSGVMLGSENPKALGEFYTKVFGEAGWQEDDWFGFDIGGNNLMVGPHSDVKGKNADAPRVMYTIESDAVKEDFDRIKNCGAVVVAEPYNPNPDQPDMWLATLADPDGNYFQLASPWVE